MKPRIIAKLLVAMGAWGAGGVVTFTLFPRLQQSNYPSPDSELALYPLFIADGLVSLFAGILVGGLLYFCLWECLVKGTAYLFKQRR